MKSISPRKKLLSDFSSQDDLLVKRALKSDIGQKRNRKPSIYDELDDGDEFENDYDQDEFEGYDEDEEDGYEEGDED